MTTSHWLVIPSLDYFIRSYDVSKNSKKLICFCLKLHESTHKSCFDYHVPLSISFTERFSESEGKSHCNTIHWGVQASWGWLTKLRTRGQLPEKRGTVEHRETMRNDGEWTLRRSPSTPSRFEELHWSLLDILFHCQSSKFSDNSFLCRHPSLQYQFFFTTFRIKLKMIPMF